MTPQEEAVQILGEVVRDLSSHDRDLKLVLRQCLHVCQLLGWQDSSSWFEQELIGYLPSAKPPTYRLVAGKLVWQTRGLPFDQTGMLRALDPGRNLMRDLGEEMTVMEARGSIDWLLHAARTGYVETTAETQNVQSQPGARSITLERVKVFESTTFTRVVEQIEHLTFGFASAHYTSLKYGNVLTDIWADYRRQVDLTLGSLKFAAHLNAIQSGLQSDNSEQWRAAVFACRNLLNDVANYLWQDSRPRYEHLKMDVSQGKFANRLAAYAHQRGLRGNRGKFFRAEVERLAVSIRSLIALQSAAHEPVDRVDARSAGLATYFLLGELVTKTDMVPVTTYGAPAVGVEATPDED